MDLEMTNQASNLIEQDKILPQQQYHHAINKTEKSWQVFYRHHTNQFFKDRTYLDRQIPQLKNMKNGVFFQMGCGVGNTLFPLLSEFPNLNYYGCDFSKTAIKFIQQRIQNQKIENLRVSVVDLVNDQIPNWQKANIISLIFLLSAITPQKHQQVLRKIYMWMKNNSLLFFRDYGKFDFSQLNLTLKKNKQSVIIRKIMENFYVKNDGICVYYFELQEIAKLAEKIGFVIRNKKNCMKVLENRKKKLKMYRVWVQLLLQKL